MKEVIIHEKDNVGVSLRGMANVPPGHKFALRNIPCGEYVIKYGEIIGRATDNIRKGEWVHSHNLKSHLDENAEYTYCHRAETPKVKKGTFLGYRRAWGRAGIRNEIYIIPTVGCVNNVCREIESRARQYVTGSIDGIYAFPHQFGCSQLGDDGENIKKLLCGVALNPNASFVLFVGLGCENNTMQGIQDYLAPYGRDNIRYFCCQEVENETEYGLKIVREFAEQAKNFRREEIDFSELCIGLKCGGSDGYSGLTANPLVGKITDRTVALGGSAVLTEVPEMFGAEQLLMNKCRDAEVFERYKSLIFDFKERYTKQGFPVYENPSPGNREGGITTLEEKSLGCIKKAGGSAINDVLAYGGQVKEHGVSVLDAPGNDLVAATALGASGCQIVLFTTGRGTPFSTFVPTMKIASNSTLAKSKANWIDFDAYTMDEEGLWNKLVSVINGEAVKSEKHREIAFYKRGVTL